MSLASYAPYGFAAATAYKAPAMIRHQQAAIKERVANRDYNNFKLTPTQKENIPIADAVLHIFKYKNPRVGGFFSDVKFPRQQGVEDIDIQTAIVMGGWSKENEDLMVKLGPQGPKVFDELNSELEFGGYSPLNDTPELKINKAAEKKLIKGAKKKITQT